MKARKQHESFGKWLAAKRKALGLTQDELGKQAAISKGYVSRLENETPHSTTNAPVRPAVALVDRLAQALNVPVEEARERAGYGLPSPPNTEQGVAVLYFNEKKYSPKRQAEARMVIELARRELDRLSREEKLERNRK